MKLGSLLKIPRVCFDMGIPIFKTKEDIESPKFGRLKLSNNNNAFLPLKERIGMFIDCYMFGGNMYLQILYGEETYWIPVQYLETVKMT